MKLVISMNEMKANVELFKKIGLGVTELQHIMEDLDEGIEVKINEFVKKYDEDATNYFKKEVYESTKFSTIRKFNENGVIFFEIIIFEEFILDTFALYSNLFTNIYNHLKGFIKAMAMFIKTDLKAFQSRWN